MKLISLKVENFGKLSNLSLSFESGLNEFFEENGWGKSTLSAFIRSMFYGLEGDRKVDSERKRFAPWQGGAFGGSLVFSVDNREYVVTRLFGSKQIEDTFELRDRATNLISKDYSERLGEELFNINRESFMKTVFIKQNDAYSYGATDDINAKLGNISDGLDLNNFASVTESIKDLLNNMSATRKTGEIYKDKLMASSLKASIQKGNGMEDTIKTLEARINDTKKNIDETKLELLSLNEKKKEASKYERIKGQKENYYNLQKEVLEKEELLNKKKEFFKGEIPSLEVSKSWEEAADKCVNAKTLMEGTAFTDIEERAYSSLLDTFSNGVPKETTVEEYIEKAKRLESLYKKNLRNELSNKEQERLSELRESYKDLNEEKEDLEALTEDWQKRSSLYAKLSSLERNLESIEDSNVSKKGNKALPILLILIGVVLCMLPLLKVISLSPFIGIGILILGVICLFITGGSKKVKLSKEDAEKITSIKEEISEIKDFSEDVCEDLENYFNDHGFSFSEDTVLKNFSSINKELFEYEALLEKESKGPSLEEKNQIEALDEEIKDFLRSFKVSSDETEYIFRLSEIQGKISQLTFLTKKREDYKKSQRELDTLCESLEKQLRYFEINPGMDVVKRVDDVLDALTEYESVLKLYNDALLRFDNLKASVDIKEMEEDFSKDVLLPEEIAKKEELINEKLDELKNHLYVDEKTLDDLLEQNDLWNEEKEELKALEETISEKLYKLDLVKKTGEFLEKAKENLTTRFMEPILTGFSKYYSILTGEESSKFYLDANMNITREEMGKQRSSEALSTGYRDLIGLCMRIAILDAMYEAQKPTLILDDPFVNLDDNKLKGAKRLLEEVKKNYQIIYFTCQENRNF